MSKNNQTQIFNIVQMVKFPEKISDTFLVECSIFYKLLSKHFSLQSINDQVWIFLYWTEKKINNCDAEDHLIKTKISSLVKIFLRCLATYFSVSLVKKNDWFFWPTLMYVCVYMYVWPYVNLSLLLNSSTDFTVVEAIKKGFTILRI